MGSVLKGARFRAEVYCVQAPPVDLSASVISPLVEMGTLEPLPAQVPSVDWEAVAREARALLDDTAREAERLVERARAQALELTAEANASVARIEADARGAGFERGQREGREAAQVEMDEMLSTMRGLIDMARVERHKIIESAEPELVRLATAIAERVLHWQIDADKNVVLDMTRAAIGRLVSREKVTVRVNPADIGTMREHRERIMALDDLENLRVVEDHRVDRGGVVIETEGGTLDAKISTQMREARRLLGVEDPLPLAPPPTQRAASLLPPAQAS